MGIQVPPDSTGKVVETNSPDGATQRQVVTLGDKTTAANVGAVLASGALKIEPGGANTQPVSAASLPLPTGASTAAKQPALGTAGTASSDVITIQGIASMTAVAISAASLPLPTGAATSANQSTINTSLGTIDTDIKATQPRTPVPATSGGTSAYHAVAAASNNAASVKGTTGQVYGWNIYNNAAYPIYVKLYNKATAPAPATDNALLIKVIGVQAGTHVPYFNNMGIAGFSSGIGVAAVKGITDTDNTSLAASDCLIELDYK